MQEHMQGDVSACDDRKVYIDAELQGKEHVSEIKMHIDLKKWNTSMKGEKKNIVRFAI